MKSRWSCCREKVLPSVCHIDITVSSVLIPPSPPFFSLKDSLHYSLIKQSLYCFLSFFWFVLFLKLLSHSNDSMILAIHTYPAEAANLCCFDGFSLSLRDAQSAHPCKTGFKTCPLNIANAAAEPDWPELHIHIVLLVWVTDQTV